MAGRAARQPADRWPTRTRVMTPSRFTRANAQLLAYGVNGAAISACAPRRAKFLRSRSTGAWSGEEGPAALHPAIDPTHEKRENEAGRTQLSAGPARQHRQLAAALPTNLNKPRPITDGGPSYVAREVRDPNHHPLIETMESRHARRALVRQILALPAAVESRAGREPGGRAIEDVKKCSPKFWRAPLRSWSPRDGVCGPSGDAPPRSSRCCFNPA